jgi:hypothetical protein
MTPRLFKTGVDDGPSALIVDGRGGHVATATF